MSSFHSSSVFTVNYSKHFNKGTCKIYSLPWLMLAHHQNLSLASSHGQLHPLLISRCIESLLMQKLLCTAAQVLQQTQQKLLWSRGIGCHQCTLYDRNDIQSIPLCALPQSSCESSGCFLLALSLAFAAWLLSKGSIHYTVCRYLILPTD